VKRNPLSFTLTSNDEHHQSHRRHKRFHGILPRKNPAFDRLFPANYHAMTSLDKRDLAQLNERERIAEVRRQKDEQRELAKNATDARLLMRIKIYPYVDP